MTCTDCWARPRGQCTGARWLSRWCCETATEGRALSQAAVWYAWWRMDCGWPEEAVCEACGKVCRACLWEALCGVHA